MKNRNADKTQNKSKPYQEQTIKKTKPASGNRAPKNAKPVKPKERPANNSPAGKIDFIAIEKYWLDSSEDAFDTARRLMRGKKYVHAMFFLHLAVEKILKGLFINHNREDAPIGHNLQNLADKIKNLKLVNENKVLLTQITSFNIAARYDDYKQSFYRSCTEAFAKEYMKKGRELILWLKSRFA